MSREPRAKARPAVAFARTMACMDLDEINEMLEAADLGPLKVATYDMLKGVYRRCSSTRVRGELKELCAHFAAPGIRVTD